MGIAEGEWGGLAPGKPLFFLIFASLIAPTLLTQMTASAPKAVNVEWDRTDRFSVEYTVNGTARDSPLCWPPVDVT